MKRKNLSGIPRSRRNEGIKMASTETGRKNYWNELDKLKVYWVKEGVEEGRGRCSEHCKAPTVLNREHWMVSASWNNKSDKQVN